MMLGYVLQYQSVEAMGLHSGKTGRAVECSSVVFHEEENAHTTIQKIEAIEFPDDADKLLNDIHETNETDQANEFPRQEAS